MKSSKLKKTPLQYKENTSLLAPVSKLELIQNEPPASQYERVSVPEGTPFLKGAGT